MNSYEEQPTPEPTEEDIREAMKFIAEEFGEKFEEDSKESTDQMITRLGQEGWQLVDVVTNAHKVTAEYNPSENIKIVAAGTKYRIFKRKKNDIHGKYNHE